MRNPGPLSIQAAKEIRLLGNGSNGSSNGSTPEQPRSRVSTPPPNLGPRRLVRPTLPESAPGTRKFVRREASPMLAHQMALESPRWHDASHAEAYYFQKQVQTQTPMVFVLEDGERIEGCIEWYDHSAIKVRNSGRTLIYKSSVKYLYKANEV